MSVSLLEKIAFLKKHSSFPDHPKKMEVKETHHSWVFLTDQYVYKLKKPISDEWHEYSTIEGRHLNCLEEFRLNRRLAKEVYLDVIPLVVNEKGELQLDGNGEIVDWLVKMKRIPATNTLDQSIKNGTFTDEEVDRAAIKLANFYRDAPTVNIAYSMHMKRLNGELQESYKMLSQPIFGLDLSLVEEVRSSLLQFLSERKKVFKKRISDKRMLEGHGDLRPEHICLRPKPLFIDCLEFNRDLRILDPTADLSFLSLECDLLEAPQIGKRFFAKYMAVTLDQIPDSLIYFYKALKALTRARLAATHLMEAKYRDEIKWKQKTQVYLWNAQSNLVGMNLRV